MASTGSQIRIGERPPDFGTIEEAKAAAKRSAAGIMSINADTIARFVMVLAIAGIFIWLNREVMHLVRDVFDAELKLLAVGSLKATERSVNTQVFTALIAATVVQTGVAIIAIVTYLFPKKPGGTP